MRQFEFLPEALGNANEIVTTALEVLPETIKKFVSDNTMDILRGGPGNAVAAESQYNLLKKYMQARRAAYDKDDWKGAEKISDSIDTVRDTIITALELMPYDSGIVEELVHVIELELQDIVHDYIEKYYGKIEPITDPGVSRRNFKTDEINALFDTKNLYWAEHIIVQLQLDGVSKKTGEPKTRGGYFSRSASKDKITSKTGSHIRWGDEFAVLINIYVDKNQIWHVITNELENQITEEVVGEYEDQQLITKLIKPIVSTFLHEVVHFEQEIRARANTKGKDYTHRTKLPNTNIPRPKAYIHWNPEKNKSKGSPNQTLPYRSFRAGRRGHYPNNLDSTNDPKVWAEYLGHDIEIEAHAAHVASEIYSDMVTDRFGYRNRKMPQEDINYTLDSRIDDIKFGYFKDGSYQQVIADKAKAAAKNPNMSNEDKRFLKVWNIFRKKLIQHLTSYKRDIPQD
jgi:hypothetical protein